MNGLLKKAYELVVLTGTSIDMKFVDTSQSLITFTSVQEPPSRNHFSKVDKEEGEDEEDVEETEKVTENGKLLGSAESK